MRRSQRIILALYGVSVAIACVWVPWKVGFSSPDLNPQGFFAGYSSLWSPPLPWKVRENVPWLAKRSDESILTPTPLPVCADLAKRR